MEDTTSKLYKDLYVHANYEIDQSQVSLLNAYDKIPSKV
jgi:hypothetical protein